MGLFLGGQIVNADSLPTENPATVAVSDQDVQAEVAAPAVTENQEPAISAEVSVDTETEPVIEVSAPAEIPIEQPLAVEEVPGESDPEYATAKFPLDPNEKLFEEDIPYVEPATAGDGDNIIELQDDTPEQKMFDATTGHYTAQFSVDLTKEKPSDQIVIDQSTLWANGYGDILINMTVRNLTISDLGSPMVGTMRYARTSAYSRAENPQMAVFNRNDQGWLDQQKMAMQELVTMSNRASVLGATSPSDRYTFGTVIPACMYAEAKAIMLRSEAIYAKIGSTTASDATLNRVKDLFANLTNCYNVYMNRSDLVTKEDLIKIYGNFTVKNSAIDNFYNF